ncbi:MAG: ribosome silencing factor [Planctomycetota bacterium]
MKKTPSKSRNKSDSGRALALLCADLIKAKRGTDISILNVSKDLQITDYFVICTGKNKKQNQAIAYTFQDNHSKLAKYGCSKPSYNSMQGFEEGQWIVVDLGAVVVHIFSEQLRQYYDLEFLWSSAPRVRA